MKLNYNKIVTNELLERIIMSLILVIFVFSTFYPQMAKAQTLDSLANIPTNISAVKADDLLTQRFKEAEQKLVPLPITNNKLAVQSSKAIREMYVTSTAYSSDVAQTDSTPCITADGFNVCENGAENVVAANFLPFGTKIKIPELFGDRIFIVHDRMNARYYYRVDIWMTSRDRAIQYGNRYIKIQVVE
ncbi:TPA: hypothetical protein DF272_04665 [Candidatus Falkowbacteria bacterium]|nr:hypothetical protein [Candidatus Falkowbacteria bacterium]